MFGSAEETTYSYFDHGFTDPNPPSAEDAGAPAPVYGTCKETCSEKEDYCCAEWAIVKIPENPIWGQSELLLEGWGGPDEIKVGSRFNVCT